MKSILNLFVAASVIFGMSAASAADVSSRDSRELLHDLLALTLKCAVRPVTVTARGERVLLPLQSTCSQIRLSDSRHATIQMENQTLYAELAESTDSDGGDLDDLIVKNAQGRVLAVRHNVAAFDEVLIALAGGHDDFPQIRD